MGSMEPTVVLTLLWSNKEEIIGAAGTIVMVASFISQHTSNTKDDKFWSRVGSLLDLLSGAVGKAAPNQPAEEQNVKFKSVKDAGKLVKHITTGKFK